MSAYHMDVVFCIDGTRGMGDVNIINSVREILGSNPESDRSIFGDDSELADGNNRYKVFVFRDYLNSGMEKPLECSQFFTSMDGVYKYMEQIQYDGGGDKQECSLEALYMAIKTAGWRKIASDEKEKYRQVIIIITDSSPVEFGIGNTRRRIRKYYPADMPTNMEKMKKVWDEEDQDLKPNFLPPYARLIIFGPHAETRKHDQIMDWWSVAAWDRTWFIPTYLKAGVWGEEDVFQARELIKAEHPWAALRKEPNK